MTERVRAYLDIEASGLKNGYPIEVGFAFADAARLSEACGMLIRHDPWLNDDARWCAQAEGVHRITRGELRAEGREPRVVADWLNACLRGADVYVDHDLDFMWLSQLYKVAGRTMNFHLRHVEEFLSSRRVSESCMVDLSGTEGAPEHRAASDAFRLRRMIEECTAAA